MDGRLIYGMAGMLFALLVGSFVLERLTVPRGTVGDLHAVLPTARERARSWAARAVLVGVEGRDLVDGRNGDRGAWEFVFADADRPTRRARVLVGSHVLNIRELPAVSGPSTGGGLEDEQFGRGLDDNQIGSTPALARRLVAYGMRSHAPATFSLEVSGGTAPIFRVSTSGRLGATWWIDARSGDLLEFRPGAGK